MFESLSFLLFTVVPSASNYLLDLLNKPVLETSKETTKVSEEFLDMLTEGCSDFWLKKIPDMKLVKKEVARDLLVTDFIVRTWVFNYSGSDFDSFPESTNKRIPCEDSWTIFKKGDLIKAKYYSAG